MKILIADDEDYTREGLIESVSWGKYDIDEIMQAVNGLEAIKMAKWTSSGSVWLFLPAPLGLVIRGQKRPLSC